MFFNSNEDAVDRIPIDEIVYYNKSTHHIKMKRSKYIELYTRKALKFHEQRQETYNLVPSTLDVNQI